MRRLTACFLALFVSAPLLAQSGIWGSRGISRRFVIAGTRLFAAEGRGVGVYDISNPSAPKRLESATRDDETIDVAVMSDTRLVSLTTAGIDEWSIASNGRLSLVATHAQRDLIVIAANGTTIAAAKATSVIFYDEALSPNGALTVASRVNAMLFHGDTLFIALDGSGIEYVDPLDLAGADVLPERAKDLALAGDTLFVAGGPIGLAAIDVSSAPRTLSHTDAGSVNFTRVAVAGTRVYIGDNETSIRIYDAANAAAPQFVATLREPARAIAASGSAFFIDGATTPLRVFANQSLVAELNERSAPVSGVALSSNGSLAYVVDKPYLRVLDVSNTAAPRELSSLLIDGIEDLVRLNGDGTRVVLFNRGDVQMVDVSNPYKPRFIGVWHSGGRPPSRAAFFNGGVVEANWTTGFHVLDFDHYVPPALIGAFIFDYWDLEALPDSDVAYVTAEQTALAAIDVADPHHPRSPHFFSLHMDEGAFVAANDNHAALLIARAPGGIHLISLANPRAPVEVNFVRMSDAVSIAAGGQTAYLATSGKISLMDVSNAAAPSITLSSMAATAPQQMAASGPKLVIADTYSLRVYGPNTPPVPLPPPGRRRPSRP